MIWTTKHGIKIPYQYNNMTKHYIPDFYIEYKNGNVIIEETKGWISDNQVHDKKVETANEWCDIRNIQYVINFMKK